MPGHKFEPFQRVLVRDFDEHLWKADFFSRVYNENGTQLFVCMGTSVWIQCIPYTPETAHLLGTTHPYEPPKPPHEYEWGQKVDIWCNGEWNTGIYLAKISDSQARCVFYGGTVTIAVDIENIRPLPDSAAQ